MRGTQVWAQVRTERLRLADAIEASSAEQWATPSLCARWPVADVAGHLVFLAEGSQLRSAWCMWRYGRGVSVNRMIDATARRWAQATPSELADRLRVAAEGRFRLAGAPPPAALAEVVVHGGDIRRPLGFPAPESGPTVLVPLARTQDEGAAIAAARRGRRPAVRLAGDSRRDVAGHPTSHD